MKASERKQLAETLKHHDVKQPYVVIDESLRADIKVCTALAMLEMEGGIPQQNIFGCDHGSTGQAPWCNQQVTKDRVAALRRLYPETMNGVGWTQITWHTLVNEAEKMGGAHIPRYQMRVGFRVLRNNFDSSNSIREMYRMYNGVGWAAENYASIALSLRLKWSNVTNGK